MSAFRAPKAPLPEIIDDKGDVDESASRIGDLERLRESDAMRSSLNVTVRIVPKVDHTRFVKTIDGPRYPWNPGICRTVGPEAR